MQVMYQRQISVHKSTTTSIRGNDYEYKRTRNEGEYNQ
jgi:hypothetical protein